jgi:hypothetical protein
MSPLNRRLAVGALLVACIVLSVIQTRSQRPGTDFHARWLAGRMFAVGAPLYGADARFSETTRWTEMPSYPPFAAMVFQLTAPFPLKTAAAAFYFLNLLLIPAAVVLTRRIFDALWLGRNRARWPLVAAVVLAAQFFLNNLNLVQVDAALFVLVLYGISAYVEGKDVRAAGAFVVASAIKIVPVFFVAWLVLRGRRRAALAVLPFAIACVALPILQRGTSRGVQDFTGYYQTFLRGFLEGRVVARYTNQNLGAAVYRLTQPPEVPTDGDYRLITVSEPAARAIYGTIAVLVFVAFGLNLVALRVRDAPVTVFELSTPFLVGHLLSGLTWKAHLVTLLFVFYAFLSLRLAELPGGLRRFVVGAIALMVVSGATGRDLVGNTLHHYIGGYSLIVWTMLVLLVGAIVCSQRFAAPRPALSPS